MKDQKLNTYRLFYLSFLSFFGTGFSPKAPGTVGSLATIPLILLLAYLKLSFFSVLIFTIVLFIISCFIADYAQKKENVQDPGWIVIDEVIERNCVPAAASVKPGTIDAVIDHLVVGYLIIS